MEGEFSRHADVTYGFTNRTPDMQLSRGAYKWILQQIERTCN